MPISILSYWLRWLRPTFIVDGKHIGPPTLIVKYVAIIITIAERNSTYIVLLSSISEPPVITFRDVNQPIIFPTSAINKGYKNGKIRDEYIKGTLPVLILCAISIGINKLIKKAANKNGVDIILLIAETHNKC